MPTLTNRQQLKNSSPGTMHRTYLDVAAGNNKNISASFRISKGQGYQGFLRKRAGSSFFQKRAICVVQGKT
jgi:hypothetical protein